MAARLLKLAGEEDAQGAGRSGRNAASLGEARQAGAQDAPPAAEANGRLAEAIHRDRQRRSRFFPKALFGEPAWDLLLELYHRRCNNDRVTVSNACVASGVPQSTALRWIDILIDMGLAIREADLDDRRKIWLVITDNGMAQMTAYLSDMFVHRLSDRAFL